MDNDALGVSASCLTDGVLDCQRSLSGEQPDVDFSSVLWIATLLAKGDGLERCEAAAVAIVCSHR